MKIIIQFFTLFVLILFLIGCSSKPPLGALEKNMVHNLSLANTKKGEIVNPSKTRAIVIATYLNPVKADLINSNEETFLVGVHVDKEFATDKKEVNNPLYKISLNDTGELLNIKKLKKESVYVKMVSIASRWHDYYLVTFAKREEKELKLTFENGQYKKVELSFSKGE